MGLDMVLNEVALFSTNNDISTTNQLMADLFDTIAETSSLVGRDNLNIEVCTPKDLLDLPLAPGYPVRRWLSSQEYVKRVFFLTIARNKPYIDDITSSNEEEFLFQEKPVKSLGYAFRKGALAVSLRSEPCWDQNRLELEHHQLDADGELTVELVNVIHASRTLHVKQHSSWIRSSLQTEALSSIPDGTALWENREKFFPNLLFCVEVEDQLQQILRGNSMLKSVIKHLSELERYCKDWDTGGFNKKYINCTVSPESAPTLQEYWKERTFHCPDNKEVTFSWHVKFNWRIYFEPLEDKKQMLIGYIGRHLRTAKHRN